MDRKPNGPLMPFVLVLMLLEVNGNPLFVTPSQFSCDDVFHSTKSVTSLLNLEINRLLEKYIELDGPRNELIPDDVPSSTISGISISENLQDICVKNKLFYLHLLHVEKYQRELFSNPPAVLGRISGHLRNQFSLLKAILRYVDPKITVLPTPSPPQLSHDDAFEKKIYGWGVIQRLKEWMAQVPAVLVQAKRVCLNKMAGSR